VVNTTSQNGSLGFPEVHKDAHCLQQRRLRRVVNALRAASDKRNWRPSEWICDLAVSGHGTKLPGEEVVRRPGSADRYLAVLELLGGGRVAVLVFLNRLRINKMSDVDEHALGSDFLAAYFFFQRIEQLVDLY